MLQVTLRDALWFSLFLQELGFSHKRNLNFLLDCCHNSQRSVQIIETELSQNDVISRNLCLFTNAVVSKWKFIRQNIFLFYL